MKTPRTDKLLEAVPYSLDHAFKLAAAYKALLEHARELEREIAEIQIENLAYNRKTRKDLEEIACLYSKLSPQQK